MYMYIHGMIYSFSFQRAIFYLRINFHSMKPLGFNLFFFYFTWHSISIEVEGASTMALKHAGKKC